MDTVGVWSERLSDSIAMATTIGSPNSRAGTASMFGISPRSNSDPGCWMPKNVPNESELLSNARCVIPSQRRYRRRVANQPAWQDRYAWSVVP